MPGHDSFRRAGASSVELEKSSRPNSTTRTPKRVDLLFHSSTEPFYNVAQYLFRDPYLLCFLATRFGLFAFDFEARRGIVAPIIGGDFAGPISHSFECMESDLKLLSTQYPRFILSCFIFIDPFFTIATSKLN